MKSSGLRIKHIRVHPLDVPLIAPFTISYSNLEFVNNVAIEVELADGSVGLGETPTMRPVTAEDQQQALDVLNELADVLTGQNAGEWRRIARELAINMPELGSVRAGIEMALLDALTRSWGTPLFQFFGGAGNSVVTDITIPICKAGEAEKLARQYQEEGFDTIKTKIGTDVDGDIERLVAIRRGHPYCKLVLDANEGYTAKEALDALSELRRQNIEPSLFEQPVPREDWEGLGELTEEASVLIAADESCRTPQDAMHIAENQLAHVLNIKLTKCGVAQALDIAAIARASNLGLMIGGMVETRIAMGFSAHFAAGLGGFDWIDLDTPLLMAEDPVEGGYQREGATYTLDVGVAGHGGNLKK